MSFRSALGSIIAVILFASTQAFAGPPKTILDMMSPNARTALLRAHAIASQYGSPQVDEVHLVLALTEANEQGPLLSTLKAAGVDSAGLRKWATDQLGQARSQGPNPEIAPTLSPNLSRLIANRGRFHMKELKEEAISSEALLLALGDSSASRDAVAAARVKPEELVKRSLTERDRISKPNEATKTSALAQYATDLTEWARMENPKPIEGRLGELRRILRAMGSDSLNSVVIVGENGVGKTAILNEIARLTALSQLPDGEHYEVLQGKRLYRLNLTALVAGTRERGAAEARIQSVINEVKNSKGKSLLVIEGLEEIVGTGKAEGGSDFAKSIIAALDNKEIPGIIATCSEEAYRKKLQKQTDVTQRFQAVFIDPSTPTETMHVLRNQQPALERYYGVTISNDAIAAAKNMSARYLGEMFEPERSSSTLKEACAIFREARSLPPAQVQAIDQKIRDIEADIDEYSSVDSVVAKDRVSRLNVELEALRVQRLDLMQEFESGANLLNKVLSGRQEIQILENYIDYVSRQFPGKDVSGYRTDLARRKSALDTLEGELKGYQKKFDNLADKVSKVHIAMVIQEKKGIPLTDITGDIRESLLGIQPKLDKVVIAQPQATGALAQAFQLKGTNLHDPKKPMVFLFAGPSGTGKTELTKQIAKIMFGSEDAMIRLNMNDYTEPHSVSRLIGSPTGYIGSEDGGQFTEQVRRRPYCIVLLDEIEKAHEKVKLALLQALDEGFIMDSLGRKIDLRNIIFVMTSNVPDSELEPGKSTTFKTEFLNRLDEKIRFNALNEVNLVDVFDIHLKPFVEQVANEYGVQVVVSEAMKKIIAYNAAQGLGAREIKRLITKMVRVPIASEVLHNRLPAGKVATLNYNADHGTISVTVSESNLAACAEATAAAAPADAGN